MNTLAPVQASSVGRRLGRPKLFPGEQQTLLLLSLFNQETPDAQIAGTWARRHATLGTTFVPTSGTTVSVFGHIRTELIQGHLKLTRAGRAGESPLLVHDTESTGLSVKWDDFRVHPARNSILWDFRLHLIQASVMHHKGREGGQKCFSHLPLMCFSRAHVIPSLVSP